MRNFYSEGLLPTFRGRKHRFSFDLTANAYDGAPLSCNFHIFFYSMHFTKFTRRSSCPWENQKRKKVLGEKKKMKKKFGPKKKERKSTILPRKEKNFFVTATSTGRALCWPSNRNLPHIMLKRKSLFFILVPALYTNIKSRLEL